MVLEKIVDLYRYSIDQPESKRQEGTLVLFCSSNSAHCMTEAKGDRKRLMCVIACENNGVIGGSVVTETVYGVKA